MGDAAQEGAEARTGAGAVVPALFGAADYAVFAALLAVSAAIGVYCAWRARRRGAAAAADEDVTAEGTATDEDVAAQAAAADEELLGGRSLGTVPVTLSLIASYVSGVTLLGVPAEVYVYGAEFALSAAGLCLAVAVHLLIFLPTLHRLRLTSVYEYLELRFDRRVRLLGSVLFVVGNFAWVPLVLYVPALALNQVTGAAVHVIIPIVSVVCIFYTTVVDTGPDGASLGVGAVGRRPLLLAARDWSQPERGAAFSGPADAAKCARGSRHLRRGRGCNRAAVLLLRAAALRLLPPLRPHRLADGAAAGGEDSGVRRRGPAPFKPSSRRTVGEEVPRIDAKALASALF